jgi:hypothetical protein
MYCGKHVSGLYDYDYFYIYLKTYPGSLSQAVEAELVSDLGSVHGIL